MTKGNTLLQNALSVINSMFFPVSLKLEKYISITIGKSPREPYSLLHKLACIFELPCIYHGSNNTEL
jgi:hypothetical protein